MTAGSRPIFLSPHGKQSAYDFREDYSQYQCQTNRGSNQEGHAIQQQEFNIVRRSQCHSTENTDANLFPQHLKEVFVLNLIQGQPTYDR